MPERRVLYRLVPRPERVSLPVPPLVRATAAWPPPEIPRAGAWHGAPPRACEATVASYENPIHTSPHGWVSSRCHHHCRGRRRLPPSLSDAVVQVSRVRPCPTGGSAHRHPMWPHWAFLERGGGEGAAGHGPPASRMGGVAPPARYREDTVGAPPGKRKLLARLSHTPHPRQQSTAAGGRLPDPAWLRPVARSHAGSTSPLQPAAWRPRRPAAVHGGATRGKRRTRITPRI